VEAKISGVDRLLSRLFRVRILYRFDYCFADRHRGARAALLSKLSGERVGAIFSQNPARPGAAQGSENAASPAFSFQHAALDFITRFGRSAKSKQHDRAAWRLPSINGRNSEQQLVTLKEETEFLRCYLDIEQVRFGDRLTVAFELEPQTLSAQVPHLILQPVVENAIQHAIAPRAERGHINIEAKRLNSLLRVAISDNGPGIRSNAIPPAKKCVGLTNVRTRLQQIYGSDFRFELTNGENEGLTVIMEIPFQREANSGIEQQST
jgi:hypothetical protein